MEIKKWEGIILGDFVEKEASASFECTDECYECTDCDCVDCPD